MQHEITRPIPLLDKSGSLTEPGWARGPLPIYDRAKLGAGAAAEGPLVVEEPTTATVVCPGQSLSVDRFGNLVVTMEVE